MIYKFKSKATGDLIMLEENGRTLLRIIGKTDPQTLKQGIVLTKDMPAAIAALQAAVIVEETRNQEKAHAASEAGRTNAGALQGIGLRQRSLPFIRMLERCYAENKEIVWGV
jgi:hypothetical protein